MRTIEAVLFDLDETLLDRDRAIAAYARALYADLGPACDEAAFTEAFIAADDHGYADKRDMAKGLIEAFGIKRPAEWILQHWSKRAWTELSCNDGALGLLDALAKAGYKTGIVTNGGSGSQRAKIADLGLEGRVGTIAISQEIGFAKPRREIFLRAAEALGVPPERCAFVGDDLEKDAAGSAGAGMKAILYDKYGRRPNAPFPRIGNLNEVLGLVRAPAAGKEGGADG